MAHARAVHKEDSAPARERFHVCHSIFHRSLEVVCQQDSPRLWPPSQTLAAFGEPCRNLRMKQLQNSRTDDAQIRLRRLHQVRIGRRSRAWRMDMGSPAAERLEIEFQCKLYIALSLGAVDYAEFKV